MTTISANYIDVEAEIALLDTWTRRHLEMLCFLLSDEIPRSFFGNLFIPFDESRNKFSPFGFIFEHSGASFPAAVAIHVIELMGDERKAEVLTIVVEMLHREYIKEDMGFAAKCTQHVVKLKELQDLFSIEMVDNVAGKLFDIVLYCSWYDFKSLKTSCTY